ncbi:MAG: hypothetical protein AABX05_00065 [Nanoarchaeota archaeon]
MKPKHMDKIESQPASFLPKNFNYYAGGHIHHPTKIDLDGYGTLTYPGALFPNNFSEIEKYSHGGYYIVTFEQDVQNKQYQQKIDWIPLKIIEHHPIILNCNHKSPEVITFEVMELLNKINIKDSIITIRLNGTLSNGKVTDIDFKYIFTDLYSKEAYFVMKNTANLQSEEYEEIKITASDPEMMEEEIIKEHLQQSKVFGAEKELTLTKTLLQALNNIKKEGETNNDFQERIIGNLDKILKP